MVDQVIRTRKRILFVTMSPEFGGTEKHLLDLLRLISKSDVELSILCLGADQYSERLKLAKIDVFIRCETNLTSIWQWIARLRRLSPDVVVFVRSWVWCFPWYTCFVAWLVGIPRRLAIVHLPPSPLTHSDGGSISRIMSWFHHLRKMVGTKRLAVGCNSTICVSNAIRDRFVKEYGFPSNKIVTIHNGVSLPDYDRSSFTRETVRTNLNIEPQDFLLVCVAKLTPQKRVDVLLRAIETLATASVRCKCVIVGDGPLKAQLDEQVRASQILDRVIFAGFQSDVDPFLRAADAFVLTSDFEGFPLSILEAMACGLPCIVTDVGGNAEAITNAVHGFVVAPNSSNAVAEAIKSLIEDRNRRARMSKMARARVCDDFDIRKRMAEIQNLILA